MLISIKIGVDIDGVILATQEKFCEEYNKMNYDVRTIEDFKGWDFYEDWGVVREYCMNLYKHIFLMYIPLIDKNIPQYLEQLNKKYNVDIVTARPMSSMSIWKQLKKVGIEMNTHYRLIKLSGEKYSLNYDYLIDDNPNLAIKITERRLNQKLLLFTQNWNKELICNGSIVRIDNWEEIMRFFDK